MKSFIKNPAALLALTLALLGAGCSENFLGQQPQPQSQQAMAMVPPPPPLKRIAPPVNTSMARYEGSLWRGSASWGNLLRDHRARYGGDLLTIKDLAKIIKVPEPPKEDPAKAEKEKPTDPLMAFLEDQRKIRERIDQEQNEILKSVESMEVEVVRVLPNGNMFVRGIHPPIYRDRNRVKYLISLQGIVRPSDVDDENTIVASKLSKAEYKIRRLTKQSQLPVGSALRAVGKEKEGSTWDRLTDFLTAPDTGNRNTAVSPK